MDELRALTRKFAETELKPLIEHDEESETFRPELIKKLGQLGLTGVPVAEEYGGSGLGYQEYVGVIEELSRVWASYAISVSVTGLAQMIIQSGGTPEQKKKYIPAMADGTAIGAFALSEAGAGSDAGSLRTTAKKENDYYILNGTKLWITNAAHANVFICFANTDFSKGYKGITAFIVEKSFPGFKIGKKEDKLGIRASSTCELLFENCEVPMTNVLGEVGKGYKIAIETLNEGRIGIGAQMVGIAQGAYEATLNYIKTREQFGKKLSDFQGVQFQLAEMRVSLEAARLMVYNAARLKDSGEDFVESAAMAKLYSSRAAEKISSMAIDLFGGNGFTKEYPVEKFWRDAKIGQIYEGTSNMQLNTIAKIELS